MMVKEIKTAYWSWMGALSLDVFIIWDLSLESQTSTQSRAMLPLRFWSLVQRILNILCKQTSLQHGGWWFSSTTVFLPKSIYVLALSDSKQINWKGTAPCLVFDKPMKMVTRTQRKASGTQIQPPRASPQIPKHGSIAMILSAVLQHEQELYDTSVDCRGASSVQSAWSTPPAAPDHGATLKHQWPTWQRFPFSSMLSPIWKLPLLNRPYRAKNEGQCWELDAGRSNTWSLIMHVLLISVVTSFPAHSWVNSRDSLGSSTEVAGDGGGMAGQRTMGGAAADKLREPTRILSQELQKPTLKLMDKIHAKLPTTNKPSNLRKHRVTTTIQPSTFPTIQPSNLTKRQDSWISFSSLVAFARSSPEPFSAGP